VSLSPGSNATHRPARRAASTEALRARALPAQLRGRYRRGACPPPVEYRATIYSGGEAPPAFNANTVDLARLVTSGPRFLYLWWP
jgi:hypothetical protein